MRWRGAATATGSWLLDRVCAVLLRMCFSVRNHVYVVAAHLMVERPRPVPAFDMPLLQISCGYYHSLFLDVRGEVYACGNNYYGQLGITSSDGAVTVDPHRVDTAKRVRFAIAEAELHRPLPITRHW